MRFDELLDILHESAIDYPREGLSEEVWDREGDSYKLKPAVKSKILQTLDLYPDIELAKASKEIRVVGSICSNQFADDADIDIHLIMPEGWDPNEDKVELQKKIITFFKDKEFVGKHPIEVYLQLDPAQDLMSDGVYDLGANKWIKGPKVVSLEIDPYEEFGGIIDAMREELEDVDELFGELKRDAIDYTIIKQAIERLPADKKENLLLRLNDKYEEIEDTVQELISKKKEWADMRKNASKPATPEEALEDVELAKKWLDTNVRFKFLARYRYLQLITDLQKMLKSENELDDREIDAIARTV